MTRGRGVLSDQHAVMSASQALFLTRGATMSAERTLSIGALPRRRLSEPRKAMAPPLAVTDCQELCRSLRQVGAVGSIFTPTGGSPMWFDAPTVSVSSPQACGPILEPAGKAPEPKL